MFTFYSPLRYPGGKTFLLKYLIEIIKLNNPIETYIEPFAGGAGAAIGLLENNYVQKIFLNDADDHIFKFWKSIIHDTNKFINKIKKTPVNIEEWYKQKTLLNNSKTGKQASDLTVGFATFYMNRSNRSGILTGSGPIGGYKQQGKWKIDARFNKDNLISRIEKIATLKNKIKLYNLDAIDFLKYHVPKLNINKRKTLIYLDPPYYEKGPGLYRLSYSKKDHINLRKFLRRKLKIKWVLSYDDAEFIRNLYQGINKNGISINHFAYKAKIGKELIISSDNCIIPMISNE